MSIYNLVRNPTDHVSPLTSSQSRSPLSMLPKNFSRIPYDFISNSDVEFRIQVPLHPVSRPTNSGTRAEHSGCLLYPSLGLYAGVGAIYACTFGSAKLKNRRMQTSTVKMGFVNSIGTVVRDGGERALSHNV